MAEDVIQKFKEVLTHKDVSNICQALKKHKIRLLAFRECTINGTDIQRILKVVGPCTSLKELTLNVGIIAVPRQVELLSACIMKNKFITHLHLHGSSLGDDGMTLLGKALTLHPAVISLDVGDCQLGDDAVDVLYDLLLPENNRPALTELTLSANPRISAQGWARLAMAVANCTSLHMLLVDYNPLGDYSASCLLVAVAASQNLELLDLEGCRLSEHTGQLILHLVQNHLGGLSRIMLNGNKVRKSTVDAIKTYLRENHMGSESESTTSDLDIELSSTTSRDTFSPQTKSSSSSSTSSTSSKSKTSDSSSESSSSEDETATAKSSEDDDDRSDVTEKEKGDDENEKDDDEDSLGEELTEVPVYYA